MLDQRIGRIEDIAVRAIVLFQLDQFDGAEILLKALHVAHVGAAERIDRLVVVADGEHRRLLAGKQLQPLVLQHVGVLEFVDQDVPEPMLIVFAQALVAREDFIAPQEQLGEIDRPLALANVFVGGIELDLAPRMLVKGLDLIRAQPLFLGARDEILQRARGIAFVVDVQGLVHALDQAELILRVEDLEHLRQIGLAMMRAQEPVAQPVEGPDPHAAGVDREHGRKAHLHLPGGLVGEGHGQNPHRAHLPGRDQPGDAGGQHARLAAAGPGEDERRGPGQGDRGELFRIELFEQIGHASIISEQPPLAPRAFIIGG